MKALLDAVRAEARRTVLDVLALAPGRETNVRVLRAALDGVGLRLAEAQLDTEIAWLHEQGLVERREEQGWVVAALTSRGADVADGRADTPGVARFRRERR